MSASVNNVAAKLDKVLDFINRQTPLEKRVAQRVEENGGLEVAVQVRAQSEIFCLSLLTIHTLEYEIPQRSCCERFSRGANSAGGNSSTI